MSAMGIVAALWLAGIAVLGCVVAARQGRQPLPKPRTSLQRAEEEMKIRDDLAHLLGCVDMYRELLSYPGAACELVVYGADLAKAEAGVASKKAQLREFLARVARENDATVNDSQG